MVREVVAVPLPALPPRPGGDAAERRGVGGGGAADRGAPGQAVAAERREARSRPKPPNAATSWRRRRRRGGGDGRAMERDEPRVEAHIPCARVSAHSPRRTRRLTLSTRIPRRTAREGRAGARRTSRQPGDSARCRGEPDQDHRGVEAAPAERHGVIGDAHHTSARGAAAAHWGREVARGDGGSAATRGSAGGGGGVGDSRRGGCRAAGGRAGRSTQQCHRHPGLTAPMGYEFGICQYIGLTGRMTVGDGSPGHGNLIYGYGSGARTKSWRQKAGKRFFRALGGIVSRSQRFGRFRGTSWRS
eukprot:gene11274-biopygen6819